MGYERQADFGTPEVLCNTQMTLTIDGRTVTVPAGTSVMRAAALAGGDIPKLCATDNMAAFGSCRLCLVEVDGMRGTPASCTTPVGEGKVVRTQTPRLAKLRKGVMEIYISDHPLDCLTCSANNDCELQDQAAAVGLRDVRYGYTGANHLALPTDTSNSYFDFDSSKCIACSRCVRACDEVQRTFALTMDGRGFASKISAGQAGDDFLSSECVSCGACVQACPTATLQEEAIKDIGKPERSVVTTCAYCGVGCTFRAEMRGEQLVRIRQGAKLIVIDPRRIDLVRSPHVEAAHHLPLQPGTNVAVLTTMAHVIVTEGLADEAFLRECCDLDEYRDWAAFVADERHSPETLEPVPRVPAADLRAAARLYATGGNAAIYYGLGVTEHSQGCSTVMAIANLAMATGNIVRPGVGVNPLRGQNNVQGACDMGRFPHELSGYRHISDATTRALFEADWSVALDPEPGLRIPNMLDAAVDGTFRAIYIQGEDVLQSDPNTHHVAAGLRAMDCVIVHDPFLNETANYAHVFLPGSTFLGTFTNSERRIQPVRKVMAPANGMEDWQVTQALANALGLGWNYAAASQIMDGIARLTPSFAGVSFARLDEAGSLQWPVNDEFPDGAPVMHVDHFAGRKGKFVVTDYVPTDERTGPRYPLLLTTGRILSHYNVGAQARRTDNVAWHPEDLLEMHPTDAENRVLKYGDWARLASWTGETTLRVLVTDRVAPGVVNTTFHHPATQANVVTTEFSDWATNCPEYKVTAVQVSPSNGPTDWQEDYAELSARSRRIDRHLEPTK